MPTTTRGRRLLTDDDSPQPFRAAAPLASPSPASASPLGLDVKSPATSAAEVESFVVPDEDLLEVEFDEEFGDYSGAPPAYDDDSFAQEPLTPRTSAPRSRIGSPQATPSGPTASPSFESHVEVEEGEAAATVENVLDLHLAVIEPASPINEQQLVEAQQLEDVEEDEAEDEDEDEEEEESTDTLNFEEPQVQAVSPARSPLRGNGVYPPEAGADPLVDLSFVAPEKSILLDEIAQNWAEDEEDDEVEALAVSAVWDEDQPADRQAQEEEEEVEEEEEEEEENREARDAAREEATGLNEPDEEEEADEEIEDDEQLEDRDLGLDFDLDGSQAEEDNDPEVSRHELLSPCARHEGPSISLGDVDSEEEGRDDEYDLGDSFLVADEDDDYSDDGTSSAFESPVKTKSKKAKAKKRSEKSEPAKSTKATVKRRVLNSSSSSSSSSSSASSSSSSSTSSESESESESESGSESSDSESQSSDEVIVLSTPLPKARPRPNLTAAMKKKQQQKTGQALMTPGSRSFKMAREKLALDLYREFNEKIFKSQLPKDLKIIWAQRLNTTAGLTPMKRVGNQHTAEIKLASKVVDTLPKLRNTLAHEMCHVATWILDRDRAAHGPNFKKWGRACMAKYSDLNITVHHSYEIQYKYIYRCGICGHEHGRHSKSINVDTQQCGCGGRLSLQPRLKADGTPAQKSAYQQYVSDNFSSVKSAMPGATNPQIMQELSRRYHAQNAATRAPPIPLPVD